MVYTGGINMKNLFYLILGSLVGWLLWGVVNNDFSTDGFGFLLTGIILGFMFGRRNPIESD